MSALREERPVVVEKFGGASLGTPAKVRRAARRIAALHAAGRRVVVVVSAAGRTTDRILGRLVAVGAAPAPGSADSLALRREADRALATGEDLSAALLAAALNVLGVPARSLRGGEAGIRARGRFGDARVARVDARQLRSLVSRGIVPVVSGFQGELPGHETATFGRGGSDTTAVALAAALGAPCHLLKEVDGVFDRDPRTEATARPIPWLTYEALIALSSAGAKVVAPEAARLAHRHRVALRVLPLAAPPLDETRGTTVGGRR